MAVIAFAVLLVCVCLALAFPASLDPAIRLKEWLTRRG